MPNYYSNSTSEVFSHRVEIEWPGEHGMPSLRSPFLHSSDLSAEPSSSATPGVTRASHDRTFLRLSVLSSSVLSRRGVALIDSYDEVSIGRDRCATPRLRLKELAVSKYHANIYWDPHARIWSLVDMGSTHGTNLISPESPEAQASGSVSDKGYYPSKSTRLSLPKTASLPRPLSHLQHIGIGGTTFVVHVHPDQLPCDACTIAENKLISLEASDLRTGMAGRMPPKESEVPTAKSLKALKRSLLSRPSYSISAHDQPNPSANLESYVDRAELRRQRFPGWRDVDTRDESASSRDTSSRLYRSRVHTPTRYLDAPMPIPLTNIGHRLLEKQGWTPGSTLGSHDKHEATSSALVEPLVLCGTVNRRGLGMSQKR
jgi:hypothetical protein